MKQKQAVIYISILSITMKGPLRNVHWVKSTDPWSSSLKLKCCTCNRTFNCELEKQKKPPFSSSPPQSLSLESICFGFFLHPLLPSPACNSTSNCASRVIIVSNEAYTSEKTPTPFLLRWITSPWCCAGSGSAPYWAWWIRRPWHRDGVAVDHLPQLVILDPPHSAEMLHLQQYI